MMAAMMEVSYWAQAPIPDRSHARCERRTLRLRLLGRFMARVLKFRANKLLQSGEILHNQLLATPQPLGVRNSPAPTKKQIQNSNEQTVERRNFFS